MVFLFFFLFSINFLDAAIGCRNHCGYYVQCNAPCRINAIRDEMGTCAECGHRGAIMRGEWQIEAENRLLHGQRLVE